MTFSIAGRCARSGAFGVAITTSSIAVGARCPHARAGVGAVSTQNVTDPNLGPMLLDLMAQGSSARDAIDSVTRDRPFIDYRQLTAVDRSGNSASWSGSQILGTHGVSEQRDCVAAGNLLKSAALPKAMTDTFAANADRHLAERLLRSLEAGLASGGEEGPVHSAALIVHHEQAFPLVNLRVDWDDDDPIRVLRKLWEDYRPQMGAYLQRAIDPTKAPSYGVPGDP
ncbi:MAG: DUF1028 domain-containing protein [Rhizobiales bacterium]|nr:DUF1028 domain-containing protein [Hyphomicrobiales bacterium]MBI3674612.1 DUF1028 domain-containing protein [Hyphomicrobiales bacterium]